MTRRFLPPIDKGKEAIVNGATAPTPSDPVAEVLDAELSIDDMMLKGLRCINALLRIISGQIHTRSFDRSSVMNLKDCMSMLQELKKVENDLLEKMAPEQIKAYLANK